VTSPKGGGARTGVVGHEQHQNGAGNGRGEAVFRPADVPAVLRNATHGIVWTVSDSSGVVFSSGCELVTLD
jgi:hypothetical protein